MKKTFISKFIGSANRPVGLIPEFRIGAPEVCLIKTNASANNKAVIIFIGSIGIPGNKAIIPEYKFSFTKFIGSFIRKLHIAVISKVVIVTIIETGERS